MAPNINLKGVNEPIAVIGSGCRFPGGADSPSKLWELLKQPRDLLSKVPNDRFNVDSFYHPDGSFHGRTNAPYCYLLDENIRSFDATFFNIQTHEAEVTDPQHRLLLETVYEALCSAGLRVEDLQGSPTAVYVGMMMNDYKDIVNHDIDGIPTYAATGTAASILSNRVSYFFDWHGPSMTIDTACSSSLVAVHHAVQQLRSGSSRVAIAAGANLILSPIPFIVESKLNMLSPTGRSRMWDEAADGYARGEGVASVVLKTLSQALHDGDSIECIIRETGVNQDGRSPGITMPNHKAQEALIYDTYKKAGLDISRPKDRCQYFEAHGTGTPAGDPQEAEAISNSFFGRTQRGHDEDRLYVGSIKTIIGHTEGTAGIAGLLKASLAVQHGVIPPNLLFNNLSSRVAPFYQDLYLVTRLQPWPKLAPDTPRRVSVNSFGFGGTNAHAIVENFQESAHEKPRTSSSIGIIPITLSANSERSLRITMENLHRFLKIRTAIQVQDVAYTLLQKRSILPVCRAFAGQTIPAICAALEREISSLEGKEGLAITTDVRRKPDILGIFTGQGAQWPAMGKMLLSTIPYARDLVAQLDESLSTLPPEYRPAWSLQEQLLLEGEASNVNNASFSQPLCCTVQILLVQLLAAAGIKFKAVVGHSSGEIACAYAAGFITASQAIRTAHLRGVMSKLAASASGFKGAMMAAGTSYEDAQELCELEALVGRICVAASNGPESVTISGDWDAILEAQEILEDESKFARLLKVDKAYHSHHMLPCASSYAEALGSCGCAAVERDPQPSSIWISSVHEGKRMELLDVTPEYWKDNLLSPVLFSQAVEKIMTSYGRVDLAIEVGCHPALKGPCLSTIESCTSIKLPYTGCMQRGGHDLDAFANALAYIWERFGSESFDLMSFNKVLPQTDATNLAKDMPKYPWDHSRSYWTESRVTRSFLRGEGEPHILLGKLSAHSTSSALQWHNSIRPRDISWLDGHQLQGQTVFPGAGFVVMAMEAAMHFATGRSVQLLEILDLKIYKAVTFDDENSLVELNLTLEVDSEPTYINQIIAQFRIDSCLSKEKAMSPSVSGKIVITCGPNSSHALPSAQPEPPHMTKVGIDSFYKELAAVGYDYSKEFRGICNLRRADSKACGIMSLPNPESGSQGLLLHPATLDVAFQTLIGAVSAPGDGLLRSLLVPTSIGRIALNPWLCAHVQQSCDEVHFNSAGITSGMNSISGDIEVFEPRERSTLFQIEGISTKPAKAASAADDHQMFSKWTWDQLVPDKLLNDPKHSPTEEDREVTAAMERTVYFYIRSFLERISQNPMVDVAPHHERQIHWFEHILCEVRQGQHLWYDAAWEADTEMDCQRLGEKHIHNAHIRLIQRVGEGILEVFQEDRNAFELMDHDGLLTEFYGSATGFGPAYYYLQRCISPITHRYQNMDILEIGAGTGGATKHILGTNQPAFNSYVFTDISSSFFEKAHEVFVKFEGRMEFRSLDIRRDPEEQGYKPHSYDMIIASNVLHATPKLQETMANVRALLKPGGQLVVVEITNRRHSRIGFIFGLFADWWAGVDEGRVLEPFVSMERWDEILKSTGFSGIDNRFEEDSDGPIFPTSVFRSTALDDKIMRLSEPLSRRLRDHYPPIVFVGGNAPKTLKIWEDMQDRLPNRQIRAVKTLHEVLGSSLEPKSTFVIVSELDEAMFSELKNEKFKALKTMFSHAKNMLWLTENAWVEHPHQAMLIGLLRTLRLEYLDIQIQVIDIDHAERLDIKFMVEQLLRLEEGSDWQDEGILWSTEPEIFIQQNRALIPRLKPDRLKNDRLNCNRREILADLNPAVSPIVLCQVEDTPYLQTNDDHSPVHFSDLTCVRIRVHYALARTIRVGGLGTFYLVQGIIPGSDNAVVALSESNGSWVEVSSDRVVPLSDSQDSDTSTLLSIAGDLLAQTLTSGSASGATILTFMPPHIFAESIVRRAKAKGVLVKFASVHPPPDSNTELWIQLHEKETERTISQALPAYVSAFYNFSVDQSSVSVGYRLSKYLTKTCPTYQLEDFAQTNSSIWADDRGQALQMLEEAVKAASNIVRPTATPAIPVQEMVTLPRRRDISTVIDWKTNDTVSARICPIDSGRLFASDKTYLLVGLTGDLGRSICRWMIMHGARHVVLSSRHPNIEPRWIDEMKKLGGNVLVLPMDVANEQSLDAGLAKIYETMPHIGGVAFGPLVLKDILFKNMDLDMMEAVLEPKVKGARLLNERLCDSNHPLDFFVMFSSFVMVCGNPGQSAYSAANAYTHSLAQQRRSRGLAGSTIDMGAIWGVGYIVRQGRDEEYDVISFKFDKVSEQELHALFAEAVVSGRPDSGEDVEIMTGMRFLDPRNRELIPHFDDPRLGYFILAEQRGKAGGTANSLESVKEQLLKATTIEEVHQIVTEGLAEKLRTTLQIPREDSVNLNSPLIDQGVDSLSAVTIGTWFSKNLNLDLPLLKILGGASIADLGEEAAERLHPSAIPLVKTRGDEWIASPKADDQLVLDPPQQHQKMERSQSDSSSDERPSSDATSTDVSSSPASIKLDEETQEPKFQRRIPMSLTQEHSWILQKQTHDPTIFNSTIGMYMEGYLDLDRLARTFRTAFQRHEIFRTCFLETRDDTSLPMQAVMKAPWASFEAVTVVDRAAAEQSFRDLDNQSHDLAIGDTMKIVDFYWSPKNHLLIIAYNRLVCDGWTYEQLFVEITKLYDGGELPLPPQYAEFAARQRMDYETGRMDRDIAFWKEIHKKLPSVLPVMSLPQARNRMPPSWEHHTTTARLSSLSASRIKEASRKHKATPMHFYLAAYYILLARLTGTSDIPIGVADANRSSLEDLSTMGFFYNILPLRLGYSTEVTFGETLATTKEHMRAALLHSRVPYHIIFEYLDISNTPDHAPLFQAMFDYKQGQAESGSIGNAHMAGVLASRLRTPYDITLEISDDPTKDPLITFKLQNSFYGPDDVKVVMNSYLSILDTFSLDQTLRVDEGLLTRALEEMKA
ncbi:beta-ketoacyl synthase domain-containing protein [Hyaloscypha variabilis F]|uniref:Beta-ketoacyl synthase domain-containing protein n=1 Tax=Hyaloscypha variabilis (strain UAMH 11265 / GT02V1 / F) TaxID=1149755 RepID=A0A2J6RTL8_HYAVF|nr:beta-ketoacyl synthase domain-containing protein [Hyaloscypha variabilis F]